MNKKWLVRFSILFVLLIAAFFVYNGYKRRVQRERFEAVINLSNALTFVKQCNCEMRFQEIVGRVGIPNRMLYFYLKDEVPEEALDATVSKSILTEQYHNIEIHSLEQMVEVLSDNAGRCYSLWNYTFEAVGGYEGRLVCVFVGEKLNKLDVQFERHDALSWSEFEHVTQLPIETRSWNELFMECPPRTITVSYSQKEGGAVAFSYHHKKRHWAIHGDFERPKSSFSYFKAPL